MIHEHCYTEHVVAARIEIDCSGASLPAYYAAPTAAGAATPSIVMAMHLSGVDADQRQTARRFASEGFAAIVPDLYARFGAPDGDGERDYRAFLPFAKRLSFETVEPDIRAAAQWLRTAFPTTRTSIAGFCMGGVMALRRAHGCRDTFAAAAIWYGRVSDIDPTAIDIPLVASFGSADAGIPVATVQSFTAGLRVRNDVKVYADAGHAFCDPRGATYDRAAAENSWQRTITFLRSIYEPIGTPSS
ncbi:MAG TPA: dienelactone hydrolase family protein [Candidatus Lustribacter sp.]